MTGTVVTAPGDPAVLGARLRTAVSDLAASRGTAQKWPSEQRTRLIAEVDAAVAILTAARADLLLAQRESGAWKGSGDASFEAWRSRTSRTGMRAATTEIRRAETLETMPGMRDAATTGLVSVEHVDAVAKVAAGASDPVRAALQSEEGQAELLALARRQDAGSFGRSLNRWAAARDAAALERGHQAQRAARCLHVVDTDTGTRISGVVDRMAGHRLRLALEAASPRPAADDERTHAQRMADALDTIAERILSLPDTTSGAAVRPHVSFVMDATAWAALRRTMADQPAAQALSGHAATLAGEPITLEDGTPVPYSEVARALCDCELTRIVVGAESAPLNLGRTQRTYTGAQRRAVIVRDRGCAWPTCGSPARWCEVHHIRWWDRDGGETSVDGGVLLCSFHHHEVHRMSLTIARVLAHEDVITAGDGLSRVAYLFTAPNGKQMAPHPGQPGRDPGSPPRQRSQPAPEQGSRARSERDDRQPPEHAPASPPGWDVGEPPDWAREPLASERVPGERVPGELPAWTGGAPSRGPRADVPAEAVQGSLAL